MRGPRRAATSTGGGSSNAVGASVALNLVGWKVAVTGGSTFLGEIATATVDSLLGTDFFDSEAQSLVSAKRHQLGCALRRATWCMSAIGASVINATVSNMSQAAGVALGGTTEPGRWAGSSPPTRSAARRRRISTIPARPAVTRSMQAGR